MEPEPESAVPVEKGVPPPSVADVPDTVMRIICVWLDPVSLARFYANAKVTRRKTTLRWNTRGEMMTPIEKRKG